MKRPVVDGWWMIYLVNCGARVFLLEIWYCALASLMVRWERRCGKKWMAYIH